MTAMTAMTQELGGAEGLGSQSSNREEGLEWWKNLRQLAISLKLLTNPVYPGLFYKHLYY